MIYDVHFASLGIVGSNAWAAELRLWEGFDPKKFLAEYIKSGKTNDSFVFITTTNQEDDMVRYIKKYDLSGHMSYEMPYKVTNGNHPDHGRKLRLRVFQSKKAEA